MINVSRLYRNWQAKKLNNKRKKKFAYFARCRKNSMAFSVIERLLVEINHEAIRSGGKSFNDLHKDALDLSKHPCNRKK
jgi:hypothetical protein